MLAALLLLWLSIWPGVLRDLVFAAVISAILWVPVVAISCVPLVMLLRMRLRGATKPQFSMWELMAIPVIGLVTLTLLVFSVPRRLAFSFSRNHFEAAAVQAPPAKHGIEFEAKLGLYQVDKFAADPRGGVFFRVYRGRDGLGPDTMSYGFVKQPNRQGTPFGAAKYSVFHVTDDWYWFRASSDWY